MPSSEPKVVFVSSVAPLMEQFVRHKRAIGYRYQAGAKELKLLDRFLSEEAPEEKTLSRAVVLKWLARRPRDSVSAQQRRFYLVRQLALFLSRLGHPAHVPAGSPIAKGRSAFMPTILTHTQVKRLLFEVDRLAPTALSPLRHLIMPEVFRLLYGCGFRVGEVLKLRVADVDLNRGVLTVRDGKFGKDRLVPPALPLVKRLRSYDARVESRPADAFFFPSHLGGSWSYPPVQALFQQLLLRCGIPHGGRGKGPRLHDLRHTFAVHALIRWYREGADINAKLPVLAAYLGHGSIAGTQYYLHLTAELFPEITERVNKAFADIIPRRNP